MALGPQWMRPAGEETPCRQMALSGPPEATGSKTGLRPGLLGRGDRCALPLGTGVECGGADGPSTQPRPRPVHVCHPLVPPHSLKPSGPGGWGRATGTG